MRGWSGSEFDREPLSEGCHQARGKFSDYLDGALDGRSMGALSSHLDSCESCRVEFAAWRSVQSALGELGPSMPPPALQAQLRDALASENRSGSYLSPLQQLRGFGRNTFAPFCLRLSAGLGATLVLLGTTAWFVGSAAPVQANDDRLADLHPPRFLYSGVPFEPIASPRHFVAVMVEAKIDAGGRVYDYAILEGPRDPETRARIETNLLASVFKPATVFGEPVPGHAMITYTAVSVHG